MGQSKWIDEPHDFKRQKHNLEYKLHATNAVQPQKGHVGGEWDMSCVKFCQKVKLKIKKLSNFGAFQSPKEAGEERGDHQISINLLF